ncbi:MAG: major capsid protein [Neptuniibacter sp.]
MNRSQSRVVDPVLSAVASGYKNATYVGTTLMPIISCPKSGIRLMKFGKEAFIKYNMRRAPGAKTATVQYGYAADPVALVQDALNGKVPREWLRDSADIPGVDLGKTAINTVMNSMHLGLEIEIAELAVDANNYGANNKIVLSGTDKWTSPDSKLKQQMNSYREAIRAQIGVYPNKCIMTPTDFNACTEHPEVKDKFKYTSSESVTPALLAKFFELEELEVGKSVWTPDENTAMTDCWSSTVLAYVPSVGERSMGVPSYGYTYVLDSHPMVEEAYFDKDSKSWIYPAEFERRPYQTGMEAGFLIQGAS